MKIGSIAGLLCGVLTIISAAGCVHSGSGSPATVADIFAVLGDSIRKGGEATRVVPAPARSYQHPAVAGAIDGLATALGLPISPERSHTSSCRWAPADSARVGMDIAVTEFEVVGDSAQVSVLRECVREARGRVMKYEAEPTWYLKRRGGRWTVIGGVVRVTERRTSIRRGVG